MKLRKILTAGAISLAALLGAPAKAHDTIRIPGEYKIVIGPEMSTWKSIEYVLFGDNEGSSRPTLEQRKVSKAVVGAYETTLWNHELPEIDQHKYMTPAWKEHMKRIIKMRTDYTGFGEIAYLDWVRKNKRINEADGIAMDKLATGDHFWLPARAIDNKELAKALDRKDGDEDGIIHADGTPISRQMSNPESDKPDCNYPEEDMTETPELVAIPDAEKKAGSLKLKAGYLSESLNEEKFMDGPKFDLDIDYSRPIGDKWNMILDNDSELVNATFYNAQGEARVLKTEVSTTFNYKLKDLAIGAGPRLSIQNASINYDGNEAELTDFAIGVKGNAVLNTQHLDAKIAYSLNKGAGGDSEQGFNPITKKKFEAEATVKRDPVIATLAYEYEGDNQEIRGVKRDNSDYKLEAGLECKVTDNIALGIGYEKNWHQGDANSTTATTYKGGVRFIW